MTNRTYETDVEFIRALAEVLTQNDLNELRVKREMGDGEVLNVHVSRGFPAAAAPAPVAITAPPAAATAAPAATPAAATAEPTSDPSALPGAVTSPMVGTAYLAPEPGAANFVSVGDQVTEGQTLMIIEAMKTMNNIPSPRAGTVKRIVVEDGAPVEFGAPLMIVE